MPYRQNFFQTVEKYKELKQKEDTLIFLSHPGGKSYVEQPFYYFAHEVANEDIGAPKFSVQNIQDFAGQSNIIVMEKGMLPSNFVSLYENEQFLIVRAVQTDR